ncbi:MAG TPA: PKD domain-containing protein [Bacteroidia bacterium]|nr:PKD domain-containing protein [Bacteroidia bacterium]
MKKTLLLFVFTFIIVKGFSQFSKVNVGATQDLFSVDCYSANDIWIGGSNQFIKSTNGGSSWAITGPLYDNNNLQITSAFLQDIALTSSTSAMATGLIEFGSDYCVLNTTNGGSNWNYAINNSTMSPPVYFNGVDANGSNAIAVGTNGQMAYSTNAGAAWSIISSGTTNYLSDVKFASADTAFAVGQNTILKSVDGGHTWSTKTYTNTTFQQISCVHNVLYVGAQETNSLLKSTDYGVTYTAITLPFTSNGVVLAIDPNTVLVASDLGLYITKDGGTSWEKFKLQNYQSINMLDNFNSTIVGVGAKGYMIMTSNLASCETLPISSFTVQNSSSSYCLGDTLILNSTTYPFTGYNYKWLINDTLFATSYNAKVKLRTEGNNTVTLVVSNANGSDTSTFSTWVVGHSINPLIISASADSVCSGNMISLTVSNTQTGVNYQLRQGYTKIGTAQAGNGGLLTFSYPNNITGITTFNILAVKTTSCFTDSIQKQKTIYLYTHPIVLPSAACTPVGTHCAYGGITNVTFGSINNTTGVDISSYFDYSCFAKTDVTIGNTYPINISVYNNNGTEPREYINVWLDINNDGNFTSSELILSDTTVNYQLSKNINIPASTTAFNQYVRMRVISDYSSMYPNSPCVAPSCGQVEEYAVRILNNPTKPVTSFTTATTVGCTTSTLFTSTSYNATSYTWNFGDGSALVTNSITPTHIYTVSGSYTMSLKACNAYGCDSTFKPVTITIPQVPVAAGCHINVAGGYTGVFSWFTFDTTTFFRSPLGGSTYIDRTCINQYTVHAGSTYSTYVVSNGSVCGYFGMWIDFNNDGLFTSTEEVNVAANVNSVCGGSFAINPFNIQIPITAVRNTPLRMRILAYDNSQGYITDGCYNGSVIRGGQAIDYTIFAADPLMVIPSFTANHTAACTNTTITFNNTTQNATTYLWNFGDGTTSTTGSPTHTYTNTGTYSVKLIASNGTYTDSLLKTNYITVNAALPVPTVTLSGTTLSTTATATHYQWYKNGTAISGDTLASFNVGLTTGTFVVVITNSNGCTTPSAGYYYHPLKSNFTCSPTAICGPNTNYTLLSNSSTNATSYVINWGDGTAPYTYNGSGGPIHTYTAVGVYTVSMIAKNGVYADTLTRTNYITISPTVPTPTITLNGNQLSTTAVASTYQWYLGGTLITGATSQTYTPTADGTYKISIDNPGCTATTATYAYNHTHAAFTVGSASVICSTAPQTIGFANTGTYGTSYYWSFGDGQTLTTTSNANFNHTYSSYGKYTVSLKACGALNCDSVTKVNYITLYPTVVTPTITLNGNVLSTNAVDSTYQWIFNNVAITGATSPSYTPTQDGFYKVTVTNNACSKTAAQLNYAPVHIGFTADTTTFCRNSTGKVTFTSTSTNATSYVWNFGDGQTSINNPVVHTYTANGKYTVKLKACGNTNCDSLTRIAYISVGNSTSSSQIQTACGSYTLNGTTYTSSGIYTQHRTNAVGCDSAITLHLTINNGTASSQTQTACGSYTLNGTAYTSSGIYTQHLTNAVGCDSAITLHLTINNGTASSQIQTACGSYTLNGTAYTSSGIYTQHRTNALGCDSTITLHLTINNSTTSDTTASVCNSFTWYGNTYISSGSQTRIIQNALGCDSVITLHLTINNSKSRNNPQVICSNQSYSINGHTYTMPGNYSDTLQTHLGCDSIVTTMLTVNPLPVISISPNDTTICIGDMFTLNANGAATYLWNTNATGASIVATPSINTTYSVSGTNGSNCTGTASTNVTVIICTTEITKYIDGIDISTYPNPAFEFFFLQTKSLLENATVEIYDVIGRKISSQKITNKLSLISLQNFVNGIYYVRVINNNAIIFEQKIIRAE